MGPLQTLDTVKEYMTEDGEKHELFVFISFVNSFQHFLL